MSKKEAAKHETWTELPEAQRASLQGGFWKPAPGDTLECVLVDRRESHGQYGGEYYVALLADGQTIGVNITADIMRLPLNVWLRLGYRGKEKTAGGNMVHKFAVQVALDRKVENDNIPF